MLLLQSDKLGSNKNRVSMLSLTVQTLQSESAGWLKHLQCLNSLKIKHSKEVTPSGAFVELVKTIMEFMQSSKKF